MPEGQVPAGQTIGEAGSRDSVVMAAYRANNEVLLGPAAYAYEGQKLDRLRDRLRDEAEHVAALRPPGSVADPEYERARAELVRLRRTLALLEDRRRDTRLVPHGQWKRRFRSSPGERSRPC